MSVESINVNLIQVNMLGRRYDDHMTWVRLCYVFKRGVERLRERVPAWMPEWLQATLAEAKPAWQEVCH